MIRYIFTTALLILIIALSNAQQAERGSIEGRIYNAKNNEPVPFANIVIWGTSIGSTSDLDGKFLFTGIKPGYVELRVSSIGFEPYVSEQLLVTNANKVFLEVALEETNVALEEVVVKSSPYRKTEESPVSLRRIGIQEIEKNPGGNRDISKVIQSFPGVASTPSFRNDVIVRGGGPSENRFYLDGVEIPNLNHFSTQGASGGPVGIINVDFVREVNFYSGAFPANRGNALSSVLEFSQIDGNKDKLKFRGAVGASDLALTLDGPLSERTTFVASARRSYLQFLFSALGLPFLPTYNDFQFKTRTRFDEKTELTVVGLGAIDQSVLNLDANETEEQRFILRYLPVNEQWNYTIGAVLKRFHETSYDSWVFSRNYLNNVAYKYKENNEDSARTFDYSSWESEMKIRYENTARFENGLKTNIGANLEFARYSNNTYQEVFQFGQPFAINYDSQLSLWKWGLFGQASQSVLNNRLILSLGFRMDANSYSSEMSNLLNQFSPRFSASYEINPRLNLNFNLGRYYQQPPYTSLGFRDNDGNLVNKQNGIKFISADHLVGGIELLPNEDSKITVEGFYKFYRNYPVSVRDSIAIASKGADFGSFGDEAVISRAEGRAYGLEALYRSRDLAGFILTLSYTLVRSEFQDIKNNYVVSAWDNRHLFNITATRSFKKNWDFGFKWRFVGGAPYTPWDLDKSSLQSAWDAKGRAYLNYSRFNTLRLKSFHQLDIRVDKEFFFSKWSLITYMDIQNVYAFRADEPERVTLVEDGNGIPLPATGNPPRYSLDVVKPTGAGTVLPTVGIIVQF